MQNIIRPTIHRVFKIRKIVDIQLLTQATKQLCEIFIQFNVDSVHQLCSAIGLHDRFYSDHAQNNVVGFYASTSLSRMVDILVSIIMAINFLTLQTLSLFFS